MSFDFFNERNIFFRKSENPKNGHISENMPKNEKNKGTLFSQMLKVGEHTVPLFLRNLANFPRYDHFLFLHDFLYKMRISSAKSMKK